MAGVGSRTRRLFGGVLLLLALSFAVTGNAYADHTTPAKDNSNVVNSAEKFIAEACGTAKTNLTYSGAPGIYYAVWLNDSLTDPYKVGINVGGAANGTLTGYKTVYIRASAYSCGAESQNATGNASVQVFNSGVPFTINGASYSTSSALSFGTSTFSLGSYPTPATSSTGYFTDNISSTGYITAQLNLSNLSVTGPGTTKVNTVTVCLKGMDPDGTFGNPTCYAVNVGVARGGMESTVITSRRKTPPSTSYSDSSNTDTSNVYVKKGDSWSFEYNVRNEGTATMPSSTTWKIYQSTDGVNYSPKDTYHPTLAAGASEVKVSSGTFASNAVSGTRICQYAEFQQLDVSPNNYSATYKTITTPKKCFVVFATDVPGTEWTPYSSVYYIDASGNERSTSNDTNSSQGSVQRSSVLYGHDFWFYHSATAAAYWATYLNTRIVGGLSGYEGQSNIGHSYLMLSVNQSSNPQPKNPAMPGDKLYEYTSARGSRGIGDVGNSYCQFWSNGNGSDGKPVATVAGKVCAVITRPWQLKSAVSAKTDNISTYIDGTNINASYSTLYGMRNSLPTVKAGENITFRHRLYARDANITANELKVMPWAGGVYPHRCIISSVSGPCNYIYDMTPSGYSSTTDYLENSLVYDGQHTVTTKTTEAGYFYCENLWYTMGVEHVGGIDSSSTSCVYVIDPSVAGFGNFSGKWRLEGKSEVKGATGNYGSNSASNPVNVYQGQSYSFKHNVDVKDAHMTGTNVNWEVRETVNGGAYSVKGSGTGSGSVGDNLLSSAGWNEKSYVENGTYARNSIVCQYVWFSKKIYNANGDGQSNPPVCIKIAGDPWTLSGVSSVKRGGGTYYSSVRVKPGDIATFKHVINVTGGNMNGDETIYEIHQVIRDVSTNAVLSADTVLDPVASYAGQHYSGNTTSPMTREVPRSIDIDDVGKKICQYIKYNPASYDGTPAGGGKSAEVCAMVPYNYDTAPAVDVGSVEIFEPGNEVPVGKYVDILARQNPGVDGETYATKTKTTEWKLTYFVVRPGYFPNPAPNDKPSIKGANSNGNVCGLLPSSVVKSAGDGRDAYGNAPFNYSSDYVCQIPSGQSGGSVVITPSIDGDVAPTTNHPLGTDYTFKIPDNAKIGMKFCFIVSVRPASSDDSAVNVWNHSETKCVVVGSHPLAAVTGGGVKADKGIYGSIFAKSGKTYGSWVEYEALSNETVSSFSSGAYLRKGTSTAYSPSSAASFNKLTIANTPAFGLAGFTNVEGFDIDGLVNKLQSQLSIKDEFSSDTDVNLDNYNGMSRIVARADITLTSTRLIKTGTVTFIDARDRTVNIASNIKYTDESMSSLAQIPQVIILAKNINIAEDVENVDAWLLAVGGGDINTCARVVVSGTDFPYTNNKIKSYKVPATGTYRLEVWGAQGHSGSSAGGKGGYSAGTVELSAGTWLYIGVGGTNGFNGGGGYGLVETTGGGASDVRIGQNSLYARAIVAGGGGNGSTSNGPGDGGGVKGGDTAPITYAGGGSQTNDGYNYCTQAGYKGGFGYGGYMGGIGSNGCASGGGGGWYGGGAEWDNYSSAGGSGWVFTRANYEAGYTSSSYTGGSWRLGSEYWLEDTTMISGNAEMPNPAGGTMIGNTGNGYVRITPISAAAVVGGDSHYEAYSMQELKSDVCSEQLKINGPVFVEGGRLRLYRTHANASDPSKEPAETINMNASAYLWAYNFASRHGSVTSTYEQHPAVRY